jgi:hypothetical protein
MTGSDVFEDICPNCRDRFEILLVRFKLSGALVLTVCPNCARVSANKRARSEERPER